jgi:hypothetical protein
MTELIDLIRKELTVFDKAPSLLRCRDAARVLSAVLDLHPPVRIWEDCGHHHEYAEDGTVPEGLTEVEEIGLVCDQADVYTICRYCCCGDSDYQTEVCVADHGIGFHDPCPTVRVIAELLGLMAEVER